MAYQALDIIENEHFNVLFDSMLRIYSDVNSGTTGRGQAGVGYGATLTDINLEDADLIESGAWVELITRLNEIIAHQGITPADVVLVEDIINADGVAAPHELISALTQSPNSISSLIDTLQANRFAIASTHVSSSSGGVYGSSSRSTLWQSLLSHVGTLSFATVDDARYFFNTGGKINISVSRSDDGSVGDTGVNDRINNLITSNTTVTLDYGNIYVNGSATQSFGFYELGTTFTTLYSVSNLYNDTFVIQAKRNGSAIDLRCNIIPSTDTPAGGNTSVNIDLSYANDVFSPSLPSPSTTTTFADSGTLNYDPVTINQTIFSIPENEFEYDLSQLFIISGGSGNLSYSWFVSDADAARPDDSYITNGSDIAALYMPGFNANHYYDYNVEFTFYVYDNVMNTPYEFLINLTIEDQTPLLDVTLHTFSIDENTSMTLGSYVQISGGTNDLSYNWSSSSANLTFNDNTLLSPTATASNIIGFETLDVTLEITDNIKGTVVSDTVTVAINDTTAPVSISLADTTVTENSTLSLATLITQSGGESPYTYQWSVFPVNNAEYAFVGQSDVYNAAINIYDLNTDRNFAVTVEITDAAGNTDQATATITATDETVPLTASVQDLSMDENDTVDLSDPANYSVSGGDGTIDLVWEIIDTGYGTLNGSNVYSSGFIDGTDPQDVQYKLTATDQGASGAVVEAFGTITIQNNIAPLQVTLVGTTINENTTLALASQLAISGGSGNRDVVWEYDAGAPVYDSPIEVVGDYFTATDTATGAKQLRVNSIQLDVDIPVRVTVTDLSTGEVEVSEAVMTFHDATIPMTASMSGYTMDQDQSVDLSTLLTASGGEGAYTIVWNTDRPADVDITGNVLTFTETINYDNTPQIVQVSASVTDEEGSNVVSNAANITINYDSPYALLTIALDSLTITDDSTPVNMTSTLTGGSGSYTYTWTVPSDPSWVVSSTSAVTPTFTLSDMATDQTITVDVSVLDTETREVATDSVTYTLVNDVAYNVEYFAWSTRTTAIDDGLYPSTVYVEPKIQESELYNDTDQSVNANTFKGGLHEYTIMSQTSDGSSGVELTTLTSSKLVPIYSTLSTNNNALTDNTDLLCASATWQFQHGITKVNLDPENDHDAVWLGNRSKFSINPYSNTKGSYARLLEMPYVYEDYAGTTTPTTYETEQTWKEIVNGSVGSFVWQPGKEYIVTIDTSSLPANVIAQNATELSELDSQNTGYIQLYMTLGDSLFADANMPTYEVNTTDNDVLVQEFLTLCRVVLRDEATKTAYLILDDAQASSGIVSVLERDHTYDNEILFDTTVSTSEQLSYVESSADDWEIIIHAQVNTDAGSVELGSKQIMTEAYFYLPSDYRTLFTNMLTSTETTANKYYMNSAGYYLNSSLGNPHDSTPSGVFLEWDSVADELNVVIYGTQYTRIRKITYRRIID